MNERFTSETNTCRLAQLRWAQRSIKERLRCVKRFRHLLAESAETLALTITQDIGRSADEVLVTDVLPTADACRFLERRARDTLAPMRISKSDRPLWLFGSRDAIVRRPHGIVGIIGTWNYPLFLNAVQIIQALTAGNGVLWKPSELTPSLATLLVALLHQAGFPEELLIQLPATREAGPALAEAEIDHLVFTGSAEVGRRVAVRLAERLIPSTLELSGCDAVIVAADADLEMAARACWWGINLNNGQTCLAVRRIFVERPAYVPFLEYLAVLAKNNYSRTLALGAQARQAQEMIADALSRGAQLLLPDAPPQAAHDPPRFPPTIVVNALPDMAVCREAAFAPVAAVIAVNDLNDAVTMQNACPYALGASIFTADRRMAATLGDRLNAGMITINDLIAPTAHPATPFGGRRQSGWGVTQGREGLLAMTTPQTISVRKGHLRPHYATASVAQAATAELLRALLQFRHAQRWRQRWAGFVQLVGATVRFPREFLR